MKTKTGNGYTRRFGISGVEGFGHIMLCLFLGFFSSFPRAIIAGCWEYCAMHSDNVYSSRVTKVP